MSTTELEATQNGTAEPPEPEVLDAPRRDKSSWLTGPGDLTEMDIDVAAVGDSVTIRSLSAGQHATIQAQSMTMRGEEMKFDPHRRQILTFVEGVVAPKFTENEANVIAYKYGPAFNLVVNAITLISESSEEDMKRIRQRFLSRR